MPRNPPPVEPTPAPSTALVIPEDIRADLLRVQAQSITTNQRLPRIKIMPAAAGLYEMENGNTTREFEGVILGHHARNVLWDRPYGSASASDDEKGPGCRSPDGLVGIPRAEFVHAALQQRGNPVAVAATGDERIDCATCPYNQFGSKQLVGGSGQGKAVTNQRAIFIMLAGRNVPFELTVTGTTIPLFDEYLMTMLNRNLPVQAVTTIFRQERKEKRGLRWAVATFTQGDVLDQNDFDAVMTAYHRFTTSITPFTQQGQRENVDAPTPVPDHRPDVSERELADDGTIPF